MNITHYPTRREEEKKKSSETFPKVTPKPQKLVTLSIFIKVGNSRIKIEKVEKEPKKN